MLCNYRLLKVIASFVMASLRWSRARWSHHRRARHLTASCVLARVPCPNQVTSLHTVYVTLGLQDGFSTLMTASC